MVIDVALVRTLIAEQFPEWADLPVSPVAVGGNDNRTFHLGDTMTVRLPSAEGYVASVAKEQRWLPVLAPHLPQPIPAPLAFGKPGAGYPWPWSVNRWLDGATARHETATDGAAAHGTATHGAATRAAATPGSTTHRAAAQAITTHHDTTTNDTPTNGAPTNGAPTNGAPTNGAPTNGAPTNGAPTNGAPTNGAPADGVVTDLSAFAVDVAEFLIALQAVDTGGEPAAGEHSFWRGAALSHYDEETRRAIAALDGRIDAAKATAEWDAALAAEWHGRPVWFHGDVANGNLLVRDGRLAGVIDFGTSGVGDPACDLVIAWTFLDAPARTAFRTTTGVDDATWQRGRGWALWKALIQLAENNDNTVVAREIDVLLGS
ncbi:aminoglycoside phosphotransferase family protein [Asanoa ferruginea]|uniref:aminoglycoside phosphotransferase family protein n=2 Tax=Asanoa ferruginea TaxID=53367 RepID=UPI001FCFB49A|nr:aminoglycoside phosphotransferase family protein [Asanoa ferruginea]